MLVALKRYADFQGRASRSEYWMFVLFVFLVALGFGVVNAVVAGIMHSATGMTPVMFLYFIFVLGVLIPSLSVGFRRLHDTDRSAWWMLIAFIPIVGSIALIVFYCLPGTPGPNRFGPPAGQGTLQETFA